jgi:hypothetical protein
MQIQTLKRFIGSRWVKIIYSDIEYFMLNKHYNICLIKKDGNAIQFSLLSKTKKNVRIMKDVARLLKEKGISEIDEKKMLEMFKEGKVRF